MGSRLSSLWVIKALAVIGVLIASISGCSSSESTSRTASAEETVSDMGRELSVSRAYAHENLTVFVVTADSSEGQGLVTLRDAFEQQKVAIRETDDPTGVEIENLSDRPVFIQAGQILRGGLQDRVVPRDVLLAGEVEPAMLTVRSVERDRWEPAPSGPSDLLRPSDCMLFSSALSGIARRSDQGNLWREIAKVQYRLGAKIGRAVTETDSPTSLAETLEHPQAARAASAYVAPLVDRMDMENAIGLVVAVNGRICRAHLYASTEMFSAMAPQLLTAAAIEAVLEKDDELFAPAKRQAALQCVAEMVQPGGDTHESQPTGLVEVIRPTEDGLIIRTRSADEPGPALHVEYLQA